MGRAGQLLVLSAPFSRLWSFLSGARSSLEISSLAACEDETKEEASSRGPARGRPHAVRGLSLGLTSLVRPLT